MNNCPGRAEKLLLKGISYLVRGKALAKLDKAEAVEAVNSGVRIMNEAILLSPEDVDNRLMRARHLLEVTIASPLNYITEVENDISYLEPRIEDLESSEKSLLFNIIADYYYYLNNIPKGSMYFRKTISIDPASTCGIYAKKRLESI